MSNICQIYVKYMMHIYGHVWPYMTAYMAIYDIYATYTKLEPFTYMYIYFTYMDIYVIYVDIYGHICRPICNLYVKIYVTYRTTYMLHVSAIYATYMSNIWYIYGDMHVTYMQHISKIYESCM